MRTLIITTIIILSVAPTLASSTDQYRACESAYRIETKAAKASAPVGFVPAPDRNRKPSFMLTCLSSDKVATITK